MEQFFVLTDWKDDRWINRIKSRTFLGIGIQSNHDLVSMTVDQCRHPSWAMSQSIQGISLRAINCKHFGDAVCIAKHSLDYVLGLPISPCVICVMPGGETGSSLWRHNVCELMLFSHTTTLTCFQFMIVNISSWNASAGIQVIYFHSFCCSNWALLVETKMN